MEKEKQEKLLKECDEILAEFERNLAGIPDVSIEDKKAVVVRDDAAPESEKSREFKPRFMRIAPNKTEDGYIICETKEL